MGDLDKLIVAKGFEKLPKVQNIAQSGHTDHLSHGPLELKEMNNRVGPVANSTSIYTTKIGWSNSFARVRDAWVHDLRWGRYEYLPNNYLGQWSLDCSTWCCCNFKWYGITFNVRVCIVDQYLAYYSFVRHPKWQWSFLGTCTASKSKNLSNWSISC